MPRQKVHRNDRIQYYRGAADFWRAAIRLQQQRCLTNQKDPDVARADLNFYVVAVQRLREVARMTRDKLQIQLAGDALAQFDARWPRFRELRNDEEHVLGPSVNPPAGIWYFQAFVADLQDGGKVEYMIHVMDMEADIEELYQALCQILTPESM